MRRLLAPRSLAVIGGRDAAEAVRQCRRIGYDGALWPVHPAHESVDGLRCHRDVASLPAAPDAAFVAVPAEACIDVVAALAARGAGGAVCYASGFAETGPEGAELQRRLLAAARGMPLLGPNCYGFVNYLDGCALWPDRAGGRRVARGVAIVTQSGNLALDIGMQRRHLPVAFVMSIGNAAALGFPALVRAMLADPRVSAIGLHVEGIDDVPAFSAAALEALSRGVPLVVLKTGDSARGAALAASHTSALAGPRAGVQALLDRVGALRVHDLADFLETLKLLHVCGPLRGARVAALACSGGEASLVADLGEREGVEFPDPAPAARGALTAALGPRVAIGNPLDYHTWLWGDRPALGRAFRAMRGMGADATMLVLDVPSALLPGEPALPPGWAESLGAFVDAHEDSAGADLVVATMPELMPAAAADPLLAAGIAPMQGLTETLRAIRAAARWQAGREDAAGRHPVAALPALRPGTPRLWSEFEAKAALAADGLALPGAWRVRDRAQALAAARALGYPVVLKAAGDGLAHKTELGLVALDLRDAEELGAAFDTLAARALAGRAGTGAWLVERMQAGAVAELLVGLRRDPVVGMQLTLGAGGVQAELLQDTVTLLLPVTREDVRRALAGLRCHALLAGHRGRPPADIDAILAAVRALLRFAARHADRLVEVELNPLLALPRGAVAVDALACLVEPGPVIESAIDSAIDTAIDTAIDNDPTR